MVDETGTPIPSIVNGVRWLHYGQKMPDSKFLGKWMIFRHPTERDAKGRNKLDRYWLKIVDRFEEYCLFHVIGSTALSIKETKRKPVICCYTEDYEDVQEVKRTAKALQEILGPSMFKDPDPKWSISVIYYMTQDGEGINPYDGVSLYRYHEKGTLYRKDDHGSWNIVLTNSFSDFSDSE